MKRILIFLLVAVIVLSAFASCGKKPTIKDDDETEKITDTDATEAPETDGNKETNEPNNNNNNNNNNQNQNIEWELYLRGNFNDNDWNNYGGYKLKSLGNGLYSITVTATRSSGDAGTWKFKIYNSRQNGDEAWYNLVDESKVSVPFEYQGSNANVQVELGTYTIYFDTNTRTIYFEKQ